MMPKRKIHGMISAIVIMSIAVSAAGSEKSAFEIRFETLSLEHGLSQSSVLAIAQDSAGFIWFATEDGLNRYDGYDFNILRQDPEDQNSPSHNYILSLCVDREGYIWAGTFNEGLDRYNPRTGGFDHYRFDPDDEASLSNNVVRVIYEDSHNTIWIGTEDGLNRFDAESGTFTRFLSDPENPSSLSSDLIRSICEDSGGTLWIGTAGGGLCGLDRDSGIFTCYRYDPRNSRSIGSDAVRVIFEDSRGALWIGTEGGGLNRFDHRSRSFERFRNDPEDPASISHDEIYAICEDIDGTLWIGTNGGGLSLLDRDTGTFAHLSHEPGEPGSLADDEVYSIYEDHAGVMWIGTYGGGISKYDRYRKKFHLYRHDPDNPNSLNTQMVWSIYEDDEGILWIGTHGGGLNRYNREKESFTFFRHDPDDPQSLSNDIVRIIMVDRSGVFWIGTNGGGLNRFDRESGTFAHYRHDPDDPQSLSHNEIRWIYEDRSGSLWIGTNGGGLNEFNRATDRFIRYRADQDDDNSLSNDFARVVIEDSEGLIWIGTQGGGIDLLDKDSGTFTHLRTDQEDERSLSSDHILCLFEDRAGSVWAGTWGGGLNRFHRSEQTFERFDMNDGLPSDAVYGILEDDRGNLWLSTNNGLSRFDPRTGVFTNYTVQDGLQSNEFNGNSYFLSSSGEMFFGGVRGFNSFFPEEIRENPHVPPVVITSITRLHKVLEPSGSVWAVKELVLSHRDYVFSFEFAALDYSIPEKNRYAYMMEGLDDEWFYTNAEKRFANFTTLPPGRYSFRVKGSNSDGVWNEEGVSVLITVTPAYWDTWGFRALVMAAIMALAFILFRVRMRSVRMKAELQAASDGQMSLMPPADPELEGFEISGTCIPASEVGGDFYDYFWLHEGSTRIGVVVADVSGKAMKAAIVASMSSGMVFSKADEIEEIGRIMTRLNHSLFLKTDERMFTAMCLAAIDTEKREFTFSISAFPEPILKSGGTTIPLSPTGSILPLGAFSDSKYTSTSVRMDSGDVVVIYTDGLSEAWTRKYEFYGSGGLKRFLEGLDTSSLPAAGIRDAVIEDVRDFYGSAPQRDDLTVVVIKAV
jgi:ligand-binding sensor domain-containing protein/serine phosphatase RsbU (regulator of sigma subunit)